MRNMIYRYVKDMTAGRMASGYSHCHRVYHLARELDTEFDDDILYAACFLHDIVVEDAYSSDKSAEKAEGILHEVGFSADKIDTVVECIKTHWPGNKPVIKEAQMLHDANLMDSLGAIGIIRLSAGAFFWYHKTGIKDVLALIKDFREKSKELIYKKSKEMAKIKVQYMDTLIAEVEKEEML